MPSERGRALYDRSEQVEYAHAAVLSALEQAVSRPSFPLAPMTPKEGALTEDESQRMPPARKPLPQLKQDPMNAFVPMDKRPEKPEQVRLSENGIPPAPDIEVTETGENPAAPSVTEKAPDTPRRDPGKSAAPAEIAAALLHLKKEEAERQPEGGKRPMSAAPKPDEDPYAVYDRAISPGDIPEYFLIGEVFNTYVIVQLSDRVLIVDKHAAHERILFDELCRKLRRHMREKTPMTGQLLMAPLEEKLYATETEALEEYRERIESLGYVFETERTGVSAGIARISQIPEELDRNEAAELFRVLADRLSEATGTVESAARGFFESRLWQASCKAAIKGGRLYDAAHLKWICDRLLQKPDEKGTVIRTCPHGRPVAFEIRKSAMDRQFGRT